MDTKAVIKSQYLAALAMLESAVEKCPPAMWDNESDKNRFWHVAYHAIFYTHLYLQTDESAFTPWPKHRAESHNLGSAPQLPDGAPKIDQPYSKDEVLEYLAWFRDSVSATVDSLDMTAESGFSWLPMNKLELQFYSIRHLQQHTGELCERLGEKAQIDVDWVGMGQN